MSAVEFRRLHERLDDLTADIGEVKVDIATVAARCPTCYSAVMGGDGQEGLSDRVVRLETSAVNAGKVNHARRLWLASTTSGLLVGCLLLLARYFLPS